MDRALALTCLIAALLAVTGCSKARPVASGASGGPCAACHGGADGNAAPPAPIAGSSDRSNPLVGAHQIHLGGSAVAGPVACQDCHPVPSEDALNTAPHLDGHIDVVFSVAASAGGTPRWSPVDYTCTSTYCHGGTLQAGGALTAPVWNATDGAASACGACHGFPPPAPHPAQSHCAACHPDTVRADGTIDVAGGKHLDGQVEVAGLTCTSCHGGAQGNPAPPLGTHGETETSALAVGAHQAHVRDSSLSRAIGCATCHPVPTSTGHADGVVELTLGGLAVAGGATPAWTRTTATCSGTYCHGATLGGGTNRAPVWTTVDGTQAACGTCHGLPPPAPHPAAGTPGDTRSCGGCHGLTVDGTGAVISPAAGGAHLNGTVEFSGHAASWMDTASAGFHAYSADRGLGACQACHGANLTGGGGVPGCGSCHDTAGPGSWRTDCTMCHGRTDNASGAPPRTIWGQGADPVRVGAHTTHVTGSTLAPAFGCELCHVRPADALDAGHIDTVSGTPLATVTFSGLAAQGGGSAAAWDRPSATCSSVYCHGATLAGGSLTSPSWTTLDGSQDACGSCHGVPPPAPHPAAASRTACTTCHPGTVAPDGTVIPPSSGGLHLDGTIEIAGHGAAWMDQASPGFHAYAANAGLAACQGCHGATLDGLGAAPACATCHGAGWKTSCTMCHGGTDNATGAPPRTTWGNGPAATTNVRVGAHTSHLAGGPLAGPIACGTCHVTPSDALTVGHITGSSTAAVRFAGVGAVGPTPSWNRAAATCATWCHGAALVGGTRTAPVWTTVDGTQAACGTCHGIPPIADVNDKHWHVTDGFAQCSECHGTAYGAGTTVDLALHVNGTVNVGGSIKSWNGTSCTSINGCHGATPRTW